jgi:hypothetical protein
VEGRTCLDYIGSRESTRKSPTFDFPNLLFVNINLLSERFFRVLQTTSFTSRNLTNPSLVNIDLSSNNSFHPNTTAESTMAEYTSVIPLLLESLKRPTPCRGLVSIERLNAVFQRIMQDIKEKRPLCTDEEKMFLAERNAWNWACKFPDSCIRSVVLIQ